MNKHITKILLLGLLLLVACSPNTVNMDTTDVVLDLSLFPAGEHIGVEFAGLLFSSSEVDQEGAWIVDSEGTTRQLIDHGIGFAYNPETNILAYLSPEEDISLINIITGKTFEYPTPDSFEHNLAFLPGTDLLVFNYQPTDMIYPWAGYLGAIDLSSNEYIILDDQSHSINGFTVSPRDGTILYDDESMPLLYSMETGPVDVPMDTYTPNFSSFGAPAFSPDGSALTFMAYGNTESEFNNAIVVIDTAAGTSKILHPYESYGQRVGPDVVWSPGGELIAIVTQGEIDAVENGVGLWLINPNSDEPEEYLLGMGTDPLFCRLRECLLYTEEWGDGSYLEAKIMQITPDFGIVQVPLPAGSFPFQWINLEN